MFDLKAFKEGIAKVLNIQTAHAQMTEAAGQIETLGNEVKTLKDQISEYERTITGFSSQKQEWENQLLKLKQDHQTAIDALNKEHQAKIETATKVIEAEKNSVAQKVTKELAGLGVPEGAVKETISGELSPAQALEHFKSLKGTDATEYYRKHGAMILKAMATPAL